MPTKKRKTAHSTSISSSAPSPPSQGQIRITGAEDVSVSESDIELALQLLSACHEGDLERAAELVEKGAQCWVQDNGGGTSLHAAAGSGNLELVEFLLRKGNAVWNIVDDIGFTAADIAYTLNHSSIYYFLTSEGVRSELLSALISPSPSSTDPSTASDLNTFLSSKLIYKKDERGQEIVEDREGNGVMMGWEKGIMKRSSEVLMRDRPETSSQEEWNVINVGFGLGIIDHHLQTHPKGPPTTHLIIEPHPDVLNYAKSQGWYEKKGVKFYEGTWEDWLDSLYDNNDEEEEEGEEGETKEWIEWDSIYFDTYSEHYHHLHKFFDSLPNLLRSSPSSTFSFFHGLGATNRAFYDVYTEVSELHLLEVGLKTEWEEVDVYSEGGEGEGEGESGRMMEEGTWDSLERKYWNGNLGRYRLPVCKFVGM